MKRDASEATARNANTATEGVSEIRECILRN